MLPINKILCGDNIEIMSQFPDESVDLVVTSPPYDNVYYDDDGILSTTSGDLRKYNGYSWDFALVAWHLWRIIKRGGVVVWVVGDKTEGGSETGSSFRQALYFKELGLRLHDTMIFSRVPLPMTHNRYEQHFEYMFVFSKGRPKVVNLMSDNSRHAGAKMKSPGYYQSASSNEPLSKRGNQNKSKRVISTTKVRGNIWHYGVGYCSSNDKESFDHPATFPEKLAQDHVLSWSNPGDLVLDPFAGSGTVCKMCAITDRNYIGIEISRQYVDIANKRLDKVSLQPKLIPVSADESRQGSLL